MNLWRTELEMTKAIRYTLFVVCTLQLVAAAAFAFQVSSVVSFWPFPGTTPLTFIFVASFFAAAAASTLWVAITQRWAGLAGVGLDYVAILAPMSILAFRLGSAGGDSGFTTLGVASLVGVLFGLAMFVWAIRIPLDRTVAMPRPVKWSFGIFIVVLVLVASRLIVKTPNIIPWKITPDLSSLIGWMFLGAAIYFAYGLLRPSWDNAGGQLAGFLAYDAVLIVPLLMRIPVAPAEQRLGLYVYIAVVVYSGLVATYYLFLNPATRLFGHPERMPAATA